MHVSQINPATNTVLPKRGIGKRIVGFVKTVQHNRWRKKMAELDAKMAVIKDLYIKGNPDIAAKVNAVNDYIMRPDFATPKINYEQNVRNICSYKENTFEYLIGRRTDINEIYNEFGSYGLIAYAENMLCKDAKNKLLPKPSDYKISECICLSDKPANLTFNEYLMSNDKGYPNDIYQRFGQYGKDMLDSYERHRLVGMGASDKFKETYHTTDKFKTIIKEAYPLDIFCYLFNPEGFI